MKTTHKQVLALLLAVALLLLLCACAQIQQLKGTDSATSVSYTHLDVYKRQ